jgi:hypothetical protein
MTTIQNAEKLKRKRAELEFCFQDFKAIKHIPSLSHNEHMNHVKKLKPVADKPTKCSCKVMLGKKQQDAAMLAEKDGLALACLEQERKMEAENEQLPAQFHVVPQVFVSDWQAVAANEQDTDLSDVTISDSEMEYALCSVRPFRARGGWMAWGCCSKQS